MPILWNYLCTKIIN